jgi:hypothetical protein
VHTTLLVRPEIASLRRKPVFEALAAAIGAGSTAPGFRVAHFAVLGNHLHLVVEAGGQRALSRGMQGLSLRMARAPRATCSTTTDREQPGPRRRAKSADDVLASVVRALRRR